MYYSMLALCGGVFSAIVFILSSNIVIRMHILLPSCQRRVMHATVSHGWLSTLVIILTSRHSGQVLS